MDSWITSLFSMLICRCPSHVFFLFFFNDTATTEIYTLSLHDALPIYLVHGALDWMFPVPTARMTRDVLASRSEEHTSELQSQFHLVCRLLLEKKKNAQLAESRQVGRVQQPVARSRHVQEHPRVPTHRL